MIARTQSDNPVISAAISGNIQALKNAISKGCTKEDKNEALLAAAEHGQMAVIVLLLQYGVDINYYDAQSTRAIMWAVQRGDVGMFNVLVNGGANVNVRCQDGSTLLMLALRYGHEAFVTILNEKGFGVDEEHVDYVCQNLDNIKAELTWLLHKAVETSNLDLVSALLEKNVDLNKLMNGQLPLLTAVKKGSKAIVQVLLAHGAKINAQDGEGFTSLHIAAKFSDSVMVELLLNHGAEASQKTRQGQTALKIAVIHNREKIIKTLLAFQGELKVTQEDIQECYQCAKRNYNKSVAEGILSEVALKEEKLFAAVEHSNFDEITRLIEGGVSLEVKDKEGITPLMRAIYKNRVGVARFLIGKNANVNAEFKLDVISKRNGLVKQGTAQWTPLSAAARHAGWEMCQLLIDAGAVVTFHDRNDVNIIGRALCNKNKENKEEDTFKRMVKVLLLAGATLDLKTLENGKGVEKKYYTQKSVDVVFDVVAECVAENIEKLFSMEAMTDRVFYNLLVDTNTKTADLINKKGLRKAVRRQLIVCLDKIASQLPAIEDLSNLRMIRDRMKRLSEKLAIIQKTQDDLSEKTAKKKLFIWIEAIKKRKAHVAAGKIDDEPSGWFTLFGARKKVISTAAVVEKTNVMSDETKVLIEQVQACLNKKLSNYGFEKMISDYLFRKPAQAERQEITQFLTKTLNENQRNQLKKYLYDAIEGWANEYKMEAVSLTEEAQDESLSHLVIDDIKVHYEDYKKDEVKASTDEVYRKTRSLYYTMPVLFEILRTSGSGRQNVDTGTWNDFVKLMKNGNFLNTHPRQMHGVFSDETKDKNTKTREMTSFKPS